MSFEFDIPLPLRNAHCEKYDSLSKLFGLDTPDAIPMWIADMDFAASPAVRAALQAEIDRGYMGYFDQADLVAEAVVRWLTAQHSFDVDPAHIRFTRGVIEGVALSIHSLTNPGDGVIVFPPVYHSFARRIVAAGREVIEAPLHVENGQFEFDLDALQASLTGREKLMIFCSPHNPGGRLWTRDEIRAIAAFCEKNDLWLVSDEIHMDLTFPGHDFIPTLVAAPEATDRTIVISAASKGFNLAGGETGFAIIPDDTLRARIATTAKSIGGSVNRFGMIMLKAAFTDGADWSEAVRAYLAENFAVWRDRVGAIPGVSVMDMNATYLSWVDFRGTGMDEAALSERILGQARLAPSPGAQFGSGGDHHRRFNIALPRPKLLDAITRLEEAFADLQ